MSTKDNRLLRPQRLISVMVKLFFAILYCFGITRLALELLDLPVNHLDQLIFIVFMIALAASLTWQLYNLAVFGGVWLVLLILSFAFQKELKSSLMAVAIQIRDWVDWVTNYFAGRPNPVANLDGLATLVCLIMAVLAYLFVARFNQLFLAAAILIYLAISHEVFIAGGLPWIVMAGCPIIVAFARKQKRSYSKMNWRRYPAQGRFALEAMPIAIIALCLSVALSAIVPGANYQSTAVIKAFNQFKSNAIETLYPAIEWVNDNHTFNIANSGFDELGDRLGGTIILSGKPVMKIAGYTQPMLMRGAIGQTYDGKRWLPGNDSELMNFNNEKADENQINAFDLASITAEDLLIKTSYSITPVERSLSTVFLAGRPTRFFVNAVPADVQFNADGLLYKQPALLKDQTLTINTLLIQSGAAFDAAIERYLASPTGDNLIIPTSVDRYLQLPELPEYAADGVIMQLALEITRNSTSKWQAAQKIENYLETTCKYSLTVDPMPLDLEFVSGFLQSKKGYCVYFATAMTMLCRAAGIPARYIEGYTVAGGSSETSARLVTEKNAHAWTEIFLPGMGWIPLDATPGGASVDPVVKPTPGPVTVTPIPTATPAPPRPTGAPEPTPIVPVVSFDETIDVIRNLATLLLLILILIPPAYLVGSLVWYRKRKQPVWLRSHFQDDSRIAVYYWQDILSILKQLGVKPAPSETPRQLIERTLRETTWLSGRRPVVESLLDGVEKALYSQHQPSEHELRSITDLQSILEKTLWQNTSRILFVLRRICYHKQKQDMEE